VNLRDRVRVLALAIRHPSTPWYAKAIAVLTLLYALSPIDLVPDFIPLLGQLDDALLIPLGLWLTRKAIPAAVWAECEARVADGATPRGSGWKGVAVVVLLWLLLLVAGVAIARAVLT
jgi:uncharacterized membrane protein YkvA (DUF1232 family)